MVAVAVFCKQDDHTTQTSEPVASGKWHKQQPQQRVTLTTLFSNTEQKHRQVVFARRSWYFSCFFQLSFFFAIFFFTIVTFDFGCFFFLSAVSCWLQQAKLVTSSLVPGETVYAANDDMPLESIVTVYKAI